MTEDPPPLSLCLWKKINAEVYTVEVWLKTVPVNLTLLVTALVLLVNDQEDLRTWKFNTFDVWFSDFTMIVFVNNFEPSIRNKNKGKLPVYILLSWLVATDQKYFLFRTLKYNPALVGSGNSGEFWNP